MLDLIIFIISVAYLIFAFFYFKNYFRKKKERKQEESEPFRMPVAIPSTYDHIWLYYKGKNIPVAYEAWKDDFEVNEEYNLSDEELLAKGKWRKVYKYKPYEVDHYEVENWKVYVEIDGEQLYVGKIEEDDKEEYDEDNYLLFFYPGDYKSVGKTDVTEEKQNGYFGFTWVRYV